MQISLYIGRLNLENFGLNFHLKTISVEILNLCLNIYIQDFNFAEEFTLKKILSHVDIEYLYMLASFELNKVFLQRIPNQIK